MRRLVSGMILILLLIGMSRLTGDVQRVRAELPSDMPYVFVYPENMVAEPGQNITVTVGVYNLTDNVYSSNCEWTIGQPLPPYDPSGVHTYPMGYLVGFDITFSWDPNVLEYRNRTVTVPFETYPNPIPPLNFTGTLHQPIQPVKDNVDASLGTYQLAKAHVGLNYFNGNGTLFQMTFRIKKEGSSPLTLSNSKLSAPPNSQTIGKIYDSPGIIPNQVRNGFLVTTKTIHVDDDNVAGPWNGTQEYPYRNITSGIANASAGDTIHVLNGIYYETVIIDKSLILVGESPSGTIIDGHVEINANNVEFRRFTIRSGTGGGYGAGLVMVQSYGCTLSNNIITLCVHDYGIGMFILGSNNNTISENLITQNYGFGIWFYGDSDYNRIVNNTFSYNRVGIFIDDWAGRCFDNVIMGNDIQYDDVAGVGLLCSVNAKIIGNKVRNCYEGISFHKCVYHSSYQCNATVLGNWIANCTYGIRTKDAIGSHITGNTVMNCIYGISLDGASNNHTVYHNNFINNVQQVNMTGANTVWDDGYPSGGNYWSDYNGTDTNFDGIGDTPYAIDEYNRDNYPLMYPRPFLMGDVNCDCQVDIYDVAAVCIAYDSKPGDPNWYPPADIAPPYGIIDIYDVTAVCVTYGQRWSH